METLIIKDRLVTLKRAGQHAVTSDYPVHLVLKTNVG